MLFAQFNHLLLGACPYICEKVTAHLSANKQIISLYQPSSSLGGRFNVISTHVLRMCRRRRRRRAQ